jgi:sensor domain CHASE-containing protein
MLQCTNSPRILNQLGHGHMVLSDQGSIHYQKLSDQKTLMSNSIPNALGTISPRIINQLGHGHKLFLLSCQGSIHYQKLSDPKTFMSNFKCFNVHYRQEY